jgi:uncharacterized membrane protein
MRYPPRDAPVVIEYQRAQRHVGGKIEQPPYRSEKMKKTSLCAALVLAFASPAAAECYADYKAKRDDPLKLHYGVAQVSDGNCSKGGAKGELAPRLAADGWTLLNVLSTFGPEGLEERKSSAGAYFLRY